MVKMMLYKPSVLKESLSKIVEMINPVFLINCEYLSVYWKEINKIKTSTKIKIVKKSIKKILETYFECCLLILNQIVLLLLINLAKELCQALSQKSQVVID